MKLWLLRPSNNLTAGDNPWDPWYDKSFGFVVRAADEREARKLAASGEGEMFEAWLSPRYSDCTELLPDGEPDVIIVDHHAA